MLYEPNPACILQDEQEEMCVTVQLCVCVCVCVCVWERERERERARERVRKQLLPLWACKEKQDAFWIVIWRAKLYDIIWQLLYNPKNSQEKSKNTL